MISDPDFSGYADDNTVYGSGNCIDEAISSLRVS